MKQISYCLVLSLALTLLFGCAPGDAPTTTAPAAKDITVDNNYVLVVAEDAAESVRQAAYCLQAVLDAKLKMKALAVVAEDPGSNAIVFTVDDTMAEGQYAFSIQGTSVHIRAYSPYMVLYAAKLLRQAWLDSNGPVVTSELCAQLSGTLDMKNAPFTYISQNILFKDIEDGNTVAERIPRFLLLMQEYQPDILAMQECSPDWESFMIANFGKAYVHSEPVTGTGTTGNPIYFRADRYEILDSGVIWLSDSPHTISQFDDASGPRTCHWALVNDLFTQQTIFVANCHPDWNNDTARARQVEVIFQELGEKFGTYPTILSGDFNSGPDGPIYARVIEEFSSSHVTAAKNTSVVDHTCHSFGAKLSFIDYIFHDDHFQADNYYILSDMYNGYISDHYGILTNFRFAE